MLAIAKTPHIDLRIHGYIPPNLLSLLKEEYGRSLHVVHEDDDEWVDWDSTDLAKELKARRTPGKAIRIYRENFRWTQAQLGEKLGVKASFVSDMENGRRAVSKQMAKTLSKLFGISVERFV